MAKMGRLSNEEREFVRTNHQTMPVEEIARHVNRDVNTLKRWIGRHLNPAKVKREQAEEGKKEIKADLHGSRAWKKLKDELTTEEVAYFEEEYTDLVEQFREDVLKTEEQQIRKAITLDILMRRNLSARKKLLGDIDRVEKWQEQVVKDYRKEKSGLSQDERMTREEFILNLEGQLASLRAAEQSKTKEFADLDNRHQKLMEALKATREQRITRQESSRQSFLGLLRELQDEERRQLEGKQMELMKEATDREYQRLAQAHVYDNGEEDQPLLTAETVTLMDEQENDVDEQD